jgi:hypothetical protein
MPEEKPVRTFTLCDGKRTKYEVNEFAIVAELSGTNVTITKNSKVHTVAKYYATSDGQHITLEDDKYHLEEGGIELYPCDS